MRRVLLLVTVVFGIQLAILVGTVLLFHAYGGSLAHEINQQDAAKFMGVANSLLSDHYFHFAGKTTPDTWLTPGYPVVVASVFFLTNHSLPILLVLLALIGAVTGGLIYLIGRELGLPDPWARAAGFLFGVSPAVIWIPSSGMGGDIFFIFLFTAAIYLMLRAQPDAHPLRTALFVGLLLGAATLTRPLGLYFSVLVFVAFFFIYAGRLKQKLIVVLFAVIGFSALVMPWMLRNELVGNHFSLSSQFAFNPFYYNIPSYFAYKNHTALDTEQNKLMDSVGTRDTYALVGSFTHYDQLSALDRQFLKTHLVSYAFFHLYKTLPFFFGSGVNVIYATITNEIPNMPDVPFFPRAAQNTSSLFYAGNSGGVVHDLLYYWPSTLERLIWLALFLLAFISPFVTRGRTRIFAIFGVVFIIAVALLASPIAQPRYRIPAEPFIWLLAALTGTRLLPLLRRIFQGAKMPSPMM